MILSIYNLRSRAVFVLALVVASAACGGTRVGVNTAMTSSRFTASELIARVKTALLNDKEIGARRIDVHTGVDHAGDITLAGRVATAAERDRAVQLARGVEGVRSVRSELQIQP